MEWEGEGENRFITDGFMNDKQSNRSIWGWLERLQHAIQMRGNNSFRLICLTLAAHARCKWIARRWKHQKKAASFGVEMINVKTYYCSMLMNVWILVDCFLITSFYTMKNRTSCQNEQVLHAPAWAIFCSGNNECRVGSWSCEASHLWSTHIIIL